MVIDDSGDPSSGGCSGSCDEILPIGIAWIHHMDMSVDRSGKDIETLGIDHLRSGRFSKDWVIPMIFPSLI